MAQARDLSLFASAERAASANGVTHDCDGMVSGVAFLSVTACAGGADTLDVKIQDSPDGTTWYDNVAFTQATAATSEKKALVAPFGRYLRAVGTNGAGATATYSVLASVKGA